MKKPAGKQKSQSATRTGKPETIAKWLLGDIRVLIDQARTHVSQAVNAGMVMLYWHVGQCIYKEILGEERAEYGEQIVQTLSEQLTAEHGKGCTKQNLFHMLRFAEVFDKEEIVYTLCRQFSWSHFRELIYLEPISKPHIFSSK